MEWRRPSLEFLSTITQKPSEAEVLVIHSFELMHVRRATLSRFCACETTKESQSLVNIHYLGS